MTMRHIAQAVATSHAHGRLCLRVSSRAAIDAAASGDVARVIGRDDESQPLLIGGGADQSLCPASLQNGPLREVSRDLIGARSMFHAADLPGDPTEIDVYQLGVLLLRLMCPEIEVGEFLRSPRAQAKVPREFRPLLDHVLCPSVATGIQTVAGFVRQFEECVASYLSATSRVDDRCSSEMAVAPRLSDPSRPTPSLHAERQTDAGSRSRSVESPLPFAELGVYKLTKCIGRGGMGDVYLALDRALNRTVAIKVLPPELARQPGFLERFRSEASAMAQLAHPALLPIYFIGEHENVHFFSMPYVSGESLAQLLARRGRLSWNESVTIIKDVLLGLAAAHQAGYLHRDIKPDNILWDTVRQHAVIADFGLAKALHGASNLTQTGMVLGTADYISPEQGRGQSVDQRSDLYSVGCVLYRMLSGRLPFHGDSPTAVIFQHNFDSVPQLSALAPDVPKVLVDIVHRLLSKQPDERFATAEFVLQALESYSTAAEALSSISTSAEASAMSANNLPPDGTTPVKLHEIEQLLEHCEGESAALEKLQSDLQSLVATPTSPTANPQRSSLSSESEETLADIQLQLAKLRATQETLRSRRDMLQARLSAAEATREVFHKQENASPKHLSFLNVAIGAMLVLGLLMAAIYMGKQPQQPPASHVEQSAANTVTPSQPTPDLAATRPSISQPVVITPTSPVQPI